MDDSAERAARAKKWEEYLVDAAQKLAGLRPEGSSSHNFMIDLEAPAPPARQVPFVMQCEPANTAAEPICDDCVAEHPSYVRLASAIGRDRNCVICGDTTVSRYYRP